MGSFTSPPCTSGVTWTIFTTVINFSEEQVRDIRLDLKFQYRRILKTFHFFRYISLRIVRFKEILGHHSLSIIETSIKAFKLKKNLVLTLKLKRYFTQNIGVRNFLFSI